MSQCNVLMIWGWEVVLCRGVEIDLSHRGMATKFHFSAIPCANIYHFSQSFIGQSKPTFIISSQLFKGLPLSSLPFCTRKICEGEFIVVHISINLSWLNSSPVFDIVLV